MTMPSSDVDTDVVRMRALAASCGDIMMWLCGLWWAWPSSLSGGEAEPELQEADELLPGLEPCSRMSATPLCRFTRAAGLGKYAFRIKESYF